MSADADRRLAVLAQALYLANLLALPGIGFAVLLWLRWQHRDATLPLGRLHLAQTIAASLWAGVLLVGLNLAILGFGGFDSAYAWMAVILYFTFFHSTLVLFGIFGLSKALAGQPFVFPLIGPRSS